MKKIIFLFLFGMPFVVQAQQMPFEQSVKGKTCLFPVFKKSYRPQFGLSLLGGVQSNTNFDKLVAVYGLDISLQCPLLCTRKNYIRQQISLVQQDGNLLKSLAIELNPQYRLIAKPNFEVGLGPGFGMVFAEANNVKKTVFTYGLGASIAYHISNVFLTLESRYALTDKVNFINSKDQIYISENLNNLRSILKIGYKF